MRKEARFLVKGSAPEPYLVHFILDGRNLSAYCTCAAGENGQYCKHRFAIMSGALKGVVSDNVSEVAEVARWVEGTDVGVAWAEVQRVEEELEALKKRLATLKVGLARMMRD